MVHTHTQVLKQRDFPYSEMKMLASARCVYACIRLRVCTTHCSLLCSVCCCAHRTQLIEQTVTNVLCCCVQVSRQQAGL